MGRRLSGSSRTDASVAEGDLLVELDSTPLRDRLDDQVLDAQAAKADYIQARCSTRTRLRKTPRIWRRPSWRCDLAELAVKQFEDEEGGTFQIELQDIELLVQEAEAGQLIEKTNLEGVEQLYKLGYRSSGELAQARLNALRSERELATALSKRRELVEYQYKKQQDGTRRVLWPRRNESSSRWSEITRRSWLRPRPRWMRPKNRRTRRRSCWPAIVTRCRSARSTRRRMGWSPTPPGNRWNREEIRAGAPVRPRQAILSLPNLQNMQVKTAVHESVLDRIKKGLRASIRVDAFPDRHYTGTVQSVAVLPDQGGWMSSDTKVYSTVVTIDQKVDQLKPGMTAVVQIHVDRLDSILAVPVQAIIQVGDSSWCYVSTRRPAGTSALCSWAPPTIVLWRFVTAWNRAISVVLNPSAIADSRQIQGGSESRQSRTGRCLGCARRRCRTRCGRSAVQRGSQLTATMWWTTLQLGIRNLLLHKLRSLLTMLGTILGVGSVIAMLAIGEGSKRHAVEQIRQFGCRECDYSKHQAGDGGRTGQQQHGERPTGQPGPRIRTEI